MIVLVYIMTLCPLLVHSMGSDLQLDELKSQLQTVGQSKNSSFLHELHEFLMPFRNISIEYLHMDHIMTVVGPEFRTSLPVNATTTTKHKVTETEFFTQTVIETQIRTVIEYVTVTTTEEAKDIIKFSTKSTQPYDVTTSLVVQEVNENGHILNTTTVKPQYPSNRENVLRLGPKLVPTTTVYSNLLPSPSQSSTPKPATSLYPQATATPQKTVAVRKVNEYDLVQKEEILHVDIEFNTTSPTTYEFTTPETPLPEYKTTEFKETTAPPTIYNSTKSKFDYSKFMNDSRKPIPPSNMIQRNSGHSKVSLINVTTALVVFSLIWFYISV